MDLIESNQTYCWWSDGSLGGLNNQTWLLSILASCAVGLSGVVPLIIVPDVKSKDGDSRLLRLLLSFAVGGLLGDVFLHLLPEAWNNLQKHGDSSNAHICMGFYVLLGIFTFVVVEMIFTMYKVEEENCEEEVKKLPLDANQNLCHCWNKEQNSSNGFLVHRKTTFNPKVSDAEMNTEIQTEKKILKGSNSKHIAGYLNLVANAIDNFTHGLAVAASFIVGTKVGLLTTAAILIHEIPHEVGDFAILLKSGFNRWEAAKAQLSTAVIGVAGAIFALSVNSLEDVGRKTSWILPFTAGGFLNIALVNILPELMKEKNPWESLKQIFGVFLGIAVMGAVGMISE